MSIIIVFVKVVTSLKHRVCTKTTGFKGLNAFYRLCGWHHAEAIISAWCHSHFKHHRERAGAPPPHGSSPYTQCQYNLFFSSLQFSNVLPQLALRVRIKSWLLRFGVSEIMLQGNYFKQWISMFSWNLNKIAIAVRAMIQISKSVTCQYRYWFS